MKKSKATVPKSEKVCKINDTEELSANHQSFIYANQFVWFSQTFFRREELKASLSCFQPLIVPVTTICCRGVGSGGGVA